VIVLRALCRFLARAWRHPALQQVGSYLGYTDRDGSPLGEAALDPEQTWDAARMRLAPSALTYFYRS
jgi:hypothetical protein